MDYFGSKSQKLPSAEGSFPDPLAFGARLGEVTRECTSSYSY